MTDQGPTHPDVRVSGGLADSGRDPGARAPWQDLAVEQNVGVLADPSRLAGLFQDDDELDQFLALRGPGGDLN